MGVYVILCGKSLLEVIEENIIMKQSEWMKGLLAAEKFTNINGIVVSKWYAETELYEEGEFSNGWWDYLTNLEERCYA